MKNSKKAGLAENDGFELVGDRLLEELGSELVRESERLNSEPPFELSAEADARIREGMTRKLASERRRDFSRVSRRVVGSAAAVLLAVLALNAVLFVTVDAYREQIFKFFAYDRGGYSEFFAGSGDVADVPSRPVDKSRIALPDGFAETYSDDELIIFENGSGGKLTYYETHGGKTLLMAEDAEKKDVTISGCEGVAYNDGGWTLVWYDPARNVISVLDSDGLSYDTVMSVAVSIASQGYENA